MDNCIFCNIAKGNIPSYKLYEDDYTLAFLDAYPGGKGHTLIIPKTHYKDIFDTPDDIYHKIITVSIKMAKNLKKALNCEGVNLLQNSKPASGQTVFHIHVHLFPRWMGDHTLGLWTPSKGDSEKLKAIQNTILSHI